MACSSSPQSVCIRSITFPLNRCVACDRHLPKVDPVREADFPVFTPECVVLIRARVCTLCLADPGVDTESGMRHMALTIFGHLVEWYTARTARSARHALVDSRKAHGVGSLRSRSRPRISGSPALHSA